MIAVDGPSGAGKSSASRGVASKLGLHYLDTGAMYRALTWWLLQRDIDITDPAEVVARAGEPVIEMGIDPGKPAVHVDGEDVSVPIRTREVSSAVSAVAAVPQVRERLIAQQREIIASAQPTGIVAEGRDIGTVVAPDAVEIDSTDLELDEVVDLIIRIATDRTCPPARQAPQPARTNL